MNAVASGDAPAVPVQSCLDDESRGPPALMREQSQFVFRAGLQPHGRAQGFRVDSPALGEGN